MSRAFEGVAKWAVVSIDDSKLLDGKKMFDVVLKLTHEWVIDEWQDISEQGFLTHKTFFLDRELKQSQGKQWIPLDNTKKTLKYLFDFDLTPETVNQLNDLIGKEGEGTFYAGSYTSNGETKEATRIKKLTNPNKKPGVSDSGLQRLKDLL